MKVMEEGCDYLVIAAKPHSVKWIFTNIVIFDGDTYVDWVNIRNTKYKGKKALISHSSNNDTYIKLNKVGKLLYT